MPEWAPVVTEGIRAAGESRPDSAADSPNLKFGTSKCPKMNAEALRTFVRSHPSAPVLFALPEVACSIAFPINRIY